MKNIFTILLTLFFTTFARAGYIQDIDVKSKAELISAGASQTALINTSKLYDTSLGEQLSAAIIDTSIVSSTLIGRNYVSATLTTPTADIVTLTGQGSTPANPGSGNYKAYVKTSNNKLTILNSSGNETSVGAGGGAAGINLVSNFDFESDVTTGWSTSGATVVKTAYTNSTSDNKNYALVTATLAGGFYQTAIIIPSFLANQDLQFKSLVQPTSGTWVINVISGTTTIASQTLIVNSSFITSPIIFVPAGAASSTLTLQYQAIASSSTLGIDNIYGGQLVDLKDGAIISYLPTYTPALVGVGTPSGQVIICTRIGPILNCHGSFNSGTPTATLFQFPLPAGLVLSSIYSQRVGIGRSFRNVGAAANILTASAGRNYLGISADTDASNKFTELNGNAAFGTSENTSFEFEVYVDGWQANGTSFDSACPNNLSCENFFSVKLSSTGVASENSLTGWFTSTSNPATGLYNVNFPVGLFTVRPNCWAQSNGGAGTSADVDLTNSDITTVRVRNFATATNSPNQAATTVFCQKEGSDNVIKKAIEGYLSKVMGANGTQILKQESFGFSGASAITACTTSPCSTWNNFSPGASVTRGGVGNYTVNFPAGTFSGVFSCQCTSSITNIIGCHFQPSTATTGVLLGYTQSTGSSADTAGNLLCTGPK